MTLTPDTWVDRFGTELYRYAMQRLRNAEDAEDVVQETFVTAWRNRETFRGEQSERNWLYTILKTRIIDHVRRRQTMQKAIVEVDPDAGALDELFTPGGHWRPAITAWPEDASQQVERAEFQEIFAKCLGQLTENQRLAFIAKEVDGDEAEQICQDLGITTSNLWVMLHRARIRLRVCLEHHWFGQHS